MVIFRARSLVDTETMLDIGLQTTLVPPAGSIT